MIGSNELAICFIANRAGNCCFHSNKQLLWELCGQKLKATNIMIANRLYKPTQSLPPSLPPSLTFPFLALNVLVFNNGRTVKLADFGSALYVSDVPSFGIAKLKGCSPHFIAPEVSQ